MSTVLEYTTCSLDLDQEPTLQGRLTIVGETKTLTVTSDLNQLQNLVTVIERYLEFLLRNERQGVFSESVAIRPLDFVAQRLTLRQGTGIAQVDLSLTQLYDLAEILQDLQEQVPDLAQRHLVVVRPWYKQPSGIAAIFVGAVSVAAAVAAILNPGEGLQVAQTESSGRAVDALTGEVVELEPLEEPTVGSSEVGSSEVPLPAPAIANGTVAESNAEPGSDSGTNDLARLAEAPEITPSWDVPADLDQPLVYILGLNAVGQVVAIEASDDLAASFQAQLPLPELAAEAEDADVVQRFSLAFEPTGDVTLLPLTE